MIKLVLKVYKYISLDRAQNGANEDARVWIIYVSIHREFLKDRVSSRVSPLQVTYRREIRNIRQEYIIYEIHILILPI